MFLDLITLCNGHLTSQPGGVLKFGFGREVPPRNLKVDPYKNQFFKKKVTQSYTNRPTYGPSFEPNRPIFPNFGKILKNPPIHAPNSLFYKGQFIYQEADLQPMLAACPRKVFCTEYTPRAILPKRGITLVHPHSRNKSDFTDLIFSCYVMQASYQLKTQDVCEEQ